MDSFEFDLNKIINLNTNISIETSQEVIQTEEPKQTPNNVTVPTTKPTATPVATTKVTQLPKQTPKQTLPPQNTTTIMPKATAETRTWEYMSDYSMQVINEINKYRTSQGKKTLEYSSICADTAKKQALDNAILGGGNANHGFSSIAYGGSLYTTPTRICNSMERFESVIEPIC